MRPPTLVDLPDVSLAVTVHGSGPVVIAAHGFPDEAGTFAAQVGPLVAAGLRVVVPTMRGYAPSGLPRSGRYDLLALGGDLLALADRFSPSEPVRILGHDWGAAAGYAAAALAPGRVSRLAALSVPPFGAFLRGLRRPGQLRRSWYMLFFQLRGLADAAAEAGDLRLVDRLWRAWSPAYRASAAEMDAVKAGLRGRVSAALDYYRALPATLLDGEARRLLLPPPRVPTLYLHGADDGCVGADLAPPEARVISGAGHFLQRERPDEVSRHLLAFFAV